MDVATRVKTLREALKLSQLQVAEQSGGRLDRPMVNKLESGKSKGSSAQVRAGLAAAAGVSVDDMNKYLDGEMPISALMLARAMVLTSTKVPTPRSDVDEENEASVSGLNDAIAYAFDAKAGHRPDDMEAVRKAFKRHRRWEKSSTDLVSAARLWLDIAMQLRKEGGPVDTEELLWRISVGKGALAADAHAKRAGEFRADADTQVANFETDHADELEPVDKGAVARRKATAAKAGK